MRFVSGPLVPVTRRGRKGMGEARSGQGGASGLPVGPNRGGGRGGGRGPKAATATVLPGRRRHHGRDSRSDPGNAWARPAGGKAAATRNCNPPALKASGMTKRKPSSKAWADVLAKAVADVKLLASLPPERREIVEEVLRHHPDASVEDILSEMSSVPP